MRRSGTRRGAPDRRRLRVHVSFGAHKQLKSSSPFQSHERLSPNVASARAVRTATRTTWSLCARQSVAPYSRASVRGASWRDSSIPARCFRRTREGHRDDQAARERVEHDADCTDDEHCPPLPRKGVRTDERANDGRAVEVAVRRNGGGGHNTAACLQRGIERMRHMRSTYDGQAGSTAASPRGLTAVANLGAARAVEGRERRCRRRKKSRHPVMAPAKLRRLRLARL
jgi:hypothetical protein